MGIKTSTKWILLTGVISTPIVYQIVVWAGLSLLVPSTPTMDFDAVAWRNGWEQRAEMIDDLIASEILLNKSSAEVLQLLGKPTGGDTATYLIYYAETQYINGILNYIDLQIIMKNDHVHSVEKLGFKDY